MSDQGPHEPVGSVGEEAVKLLQALQGWAKDTSGEYAEAGAAAAAGAASTLGSINEHIATGGDDCRYCPVCQVISTVRQASPEVRAHLATAASSLAQAFAGMLATPDPAAARRDAPVEKIDLDADEADGADDVEDREEDD